MDAREAIEKLELYGYCILEGLLSRDETEELEQAYFVVEPFTGSEAIAHTMLSFRFRDGKTYVASVEARRKEGESYNAPLAAVLARRSAALSVASLTTGSISG